MSSSILSTGLDPLRYVTLRALFAQELVALCPPPGPGRRRGAVAHGRALINAVNEDLDEIDEQHRLRVARLRDSAASVTDLALELTTFLYAAGAPHPRWRRWASLAAFGSHLQGDLVGALRYGAMAGEWAYVDRLSVELPPTRQLVDLALWRVIGADLEPAEEALLEEAGEEPSRRAWRDLAVAIPGRDAERALGALSALADDWLASIEGEWEAYDYRAFPCFDPALCAAAALARRALGALPVDGLTPARRAALDPGSAPGDLEPLYERGWKV